jgi:hypothetical protein
MIKLIRPTAMALAMVALLALALASGALAGDYHIGAGLHCSDCHIMHASKDGTLYNGGAGFAGLLKGGTVNQLCMACHDGTDPVAPDVVATGTAAAPNDTLGIAYASKYKNCGGFFQSDYSTLASNFGHNLGGGAVTAVQGTWASSATGMKCTDCHGPHGTANYRNLVLKPGTAVADVTVRGGVSGTQEVYLKENIVVPATTPDTATHYDTDAVSFNDPNNLVSWCLGCHTNITTGEKHPQDAAIGAGDSDGAHWLSGTGAGFGTDIGDAGRGIPRVRFAQTGTSYDTARVPSASTNKVFCLSCHKGHGSKYDSTIVWPHFTRDAADRPAACNQCHNKGL